MKVVAVIVLATAVLYFFFVIWRDFDSDIS